MVRLWWSKSAIWGEKVHDVSTGHIWLVKLLSDIVYLFRTFNLQILTVWAILTLLRTHWLPIFAAKTASLLKTSCSHKHHICDIGPTAFGARPRWPPSFPHSLKNQLSQYNWPYSMRFCHFSNICPYSRQLAARARFARGQPISRANYE